MFAGYRRAVIVVARVTVHDIWIELGWQGTDHVGERHVRSPGHSVVDGLASPHPITLRVRACDAAYRLSRIVPHGEEPAIRAHRDVRLPLGTSGGVRVQLKWGAERCTAVGGTDIINVAGVSIRTMRGINVVDNVIDGGRLTPAHVPPVTAEHGGEVAVAASARARTQKVRTGVGVDPGVTTVG